jgi:D-beta-D-heptose 7-phosphate kinase/D-beta-D-heptose 1-phosphate adenosyltransferase
MLLPPLDPDRARGIVAGFGAARVLVVGDAMLDRFIVGRVARISPEAPVPVVAFDHEMVRIGGAANVAHNVVAFGGQARLVAPTGMDEAAAALTQACRETGISPSFTGDGARPTTTKVRVVTERNQQVARIDYEDDAEVAGDIENRLITAIRQFAPDSDAIIVSDYRKGCVTARVMRAAVEAAAARGIGVFVDPKVAHVDRYAGAAVITPNHHEAESATHVPVRSYEDARAAARLFRAQAKCDAVLMTRGDQGMWLSSNDAEGYLAASAREVADVTGAGDTVIATLATAVAAGATLVEAARLANTAAGIAVAKFGPATVSPAELLLACGAVADV